MRWSGPLTDERRLARKVEILTVLAAHSGNCAAAGRELGLHRQSVRTVRDWGLRVAFREAFRLKAETPRDGYLSAGVFWTTRGKTWRRTSAGWEEMAWTLPPWTPLIGKEIPG